MFEKKEEEKPILSKKEYYMINNELLEYFSFDDKKTSVQESYSFVKFISFKIRL